MSLWDKSYLRCLRLVYRSTLKICFLHICASYNVLLCICYCFSHLFGPYFLSHDYLGFFTRFFIYFLFLSDEGPTLETLDYTIRIGSTPTFLYFDSYLYSAYAAHYRHCVEFKISAWIIKLHLYSIRTV